jgi:Virulence factor BrkB
MNPVEHALRRVDRYQQQHAWLAVPVALVRKFGDDKGGELTTLLTYNAFFALLPLLLLMVTLLGYLLGHHPDLEQRVLHSALAEFPILGTQLERNVHSLRATGIGLAVGIAGLLWGARRLWPRSLLQPPLTRPDQRALTDLAKQEERRPEQSVEVTFTPEPEPSQRSRSTDPRREP